LARPQEGACREVADDRVVVNDLCDLREAQAELPPDPALASIESYSPAYELCVQRHRHPRMHMAHRMIEAQPAAKAVSGAEGAPPGSRQRNLERERRSPTAGTARASKQQRGYLRSGDTPRCRSSPEAEVAPSPRRARCPASCAGWCWRPPRI
jgi:hypothetical protein